MTRPNITFQSIAAPSVDTPPAPSQVSRGAGGNKLAPPSRAAYAFLKRSQFVQTLLDVLCLAFLLLFVSVTAVGLVAAFAILFLFAV